MTTSTKVAFTFPNETWSKVQIHWKSIENFIKSSIITPDCNVDASITFLNQNIFNHKEPNQNDHSEKPLFTTSVSVKTLDDIMTEIDNDVKNEVKSNDDGKTALTTKEELKLDVPGKTMEFIQEPVE